MIKHPLLEWINKRLLSIILIIVLASSILLIQFLLLPRGIISHDFALNLFAELTGLIVTVFIIDYIISWNDTRIWLRVEKSVKQLLGQELHQIIIDTQNFIEMNSLSNEKNEKVFFDKINYILNNEVKLNQRLGKMIQNDNYVDLFERRKTYLDTIELKYSKFFDPDVLNILIILERRLHSLHTKIRSRQSRIKNGWVLHQSEQEFEESVISSIKNIHWEILELTKQDIKIYF